MSFPTYDFISPVDFEITKEERGFLDEKSATHLVWRKGDRVKFEPYSRPDVGSEAGCFRGSTNGGEIVRDRCVAHVRARLDRILNPPKQLTRSECLAEEIDFQTLPTCTDPISALVSGMARLSNRAL